MERCAGKLARANGEEIPKHHIVHDQVGALTDVAHAGVVDVDAEHEATWLTAPLPLKVGRSRPHERAAAEARVEDASSLANDGPLGEQARDAVRRVVGAQQSALGNGHAIDLKRTGVVGTSDGESSGRLGVAPLSESRRDPVVVYFCQSLLL